MNEQPTPQPSEAEEDQNIFLAVVLGMGTAAVFGLGGFFLLQDGTGAKGEVIFLLLPVATGFATALVARGKKWDVNNKDRTNNFETFTGMVLATTRENRS